MASELDKFIMRNGAPGGAQPKPVKVVEDDDDEMKDKASKPAPISGGY